MSNVTRNVTCWFNATEKWSNMNDAVIVTHLL